VTQKRVAKEADLVYTHCRYIFHKEPVMEISIQKWGNSLALRIPQALAKGARLKQGSKADLRLTGGKLVIRPLSRKQWSLEALLEGITKENRHREIRTDGPHGRESW
jgi:antitoxin MazE